MISARMTGALIAGALCMASLSGCMSLMMSPEQKTQACDSYGSMLTQTQTPLAPDQRKQLIESMKSMDCPNTPAS